MGRAEDCLYQSGSSTPQHGQAFVTNSYDAKGRRIIKVVNNTGLWDRACNYYYNKDQQIEPHPCAGQEEFLNRIDKKFYS